MKKIINGKKYDTETAPAIETYQSNYPMNDFRYYEESLHRKKNGDFFLYGEGGPMSKYCEHYGDSTSGSCDIIPLTIDEAKAWCAVKMTVDDYETLFGEVEE